MSRRSLYVAGLMLLVTSFSHAQNHSVNGISFSEENLIAAHNLADDVAEILSVIPGVGSKAEGLIKGVTGVALPDELSVMRREMKNNQRKLLDGLTQLDNKIASVSQNLSDLGKKIDRQPEESYFVEVRALHLEILDNTNLSSEKFSHWKNKIAGLVYKAEALTEVRERRETFGVALVETALVLDHLQTQEAKQGAQPDRKFYAAKSQQLREIVSKSTSESSFSDERLKALEQYYSYLAKDANSKLTALSLSTNSKTKIISFHGTEPDGPPDVEITFIPPSRVETQHYRDCVICQRINSTCEYLHEIRFYRAVSNAGLKTESSAPSGSATVKLGKSDRPVSERAVELIDAYNSAAVKANDAAAWLLTARTYRKLFDCTDQVAKRFQFAQTNGNPAK